MRSRIILNNGDKINKSMIKQLIKGIGDNDFIPDLKAKASLHKDIDVLNKAISFDIETTSYNDNGNKVGIMYLWGMTMNDVNIVGRNWQQFIDLINGLQSALELDESKQIIIWVHNLGFEMSWLCKLFKFDDVFATAPHKPITARTGGIVFRDSYILSGLSLADTAKNYDLPIEKLVGDLDYSLVRTPLTEITNQEMEYLINDIDIVYYYIQQQMEIYKYIPVIPLTNTSRVRNLLRDKCLNITKPSGKKVNNVPYVNLMNNLEMNEEEYQKLMEAYWGAFCHSNFRNSDKVLDNVTSLDEASAYPFALCSRKYPMGPARKVDVNSLTFEELNEYLFNGLSLVGIEAENILSVAYDDFLSSDRCYTEDACVHNGRIHAAGYVSTFMTNIDFKIFLNSYEFDNFAITEIYVYDDVDYLPKEFLDVVLSLYENKTKLKGIKEKKAMYNLYKAMLNAIYGCLCQKYDMQYNGLNDDGEWVQKEKDLTKAIKKINTSKAKFGDLRWGVFCTAYARENLWESIFECGEDYCYSDTDSCKTLNYERHKEWFNNYNKKCQNMTDVCLTYRGLDPERARPNGKQLGCWCYEGTYDKFKTIGAKRYLTETNNELELTCAGVGKTGGTNYLSQLSNPFETFEDGIIFPASYSGKTISTYTGERKGTVIDYTGKSYDYHELSSLHIENTDCTISLVEDFKNELNKLKGNI